MNCSKSSACGTRQGSNTIPATDYNGTSLKTKRSLIQTMNRPLKVFLCHSSQDKPAVRELYQKLRAEAWIQPWLDEEELYPGHDWNLEIEKAIEETDVIIVCLSNNSITKEGYVQREIRIALDYADYKPEGTLFIIPVRLEDCKPPKRLLRWQYADYFEGQRERGLERLIASFKIIDSNVRCRTISDIYKRYDEIAKNHIKINCEIIKSLLNDIEAAETRWGEGEFEKGWISSAQSELRKWKFELEELEIHVAKSWKLLEEAKAGNDESIFFSVTDELFRFHDYKERDEVHKIYNEVGKWARAFREISNALEEFQSAANKNEFSVKVKLARAVQEFDCNQEMYISRKANRELS